MAADIQSTPLNQNNHNGDDVNEEPIELLRRYMRLFWHWAWLIALATIVGGGAAFLFTRQQLPVYETSTTLMVEVSNIETSYNAVLTNQRLTQTYATIMLNEDILQEVIERLNIMSSPSKLAKFIDVSPVRDTQLIEITVEGTNDALIAWIANTLVEVFIDKIKTVQSARFSSSQESLENQLNEVNRLLNDAKDQLEKSADPDKQDRLEANVIQYTQIYSTLLANYEQARLAETQSTSNVVQLNKAQTPLKPVGPSVMRNTALAALLALMVAMGGIYLVDSLDDTIRNPEQVSKALGLPVLGVIFEHADGDLPITQAHPRSPVSESFRVLRTNIQYSNIDHTVRTILVTSPSSGEGKTIVGVNLAVVLAQGGNRVALLDSDLRRPTIHKKLGIPNSPGITSVLIAPEINLSGALQKTKTAGLFAMSSGDMPVNPSEMLGSRKMGRLINELKEHLDIVVLDAAPVLPVADAAVLSQAVDGVILVVRPGSTTMAAARQAVQQLRQVNARLLGVVLNAVRLNEYRYGYYYQKGYYPQVGQYSMEKPVEDVEPLLLVEE